MSDLHFEMHAIMPDQAAKHMPSGDILILAGDIFAQKMKPNPTCHLAYFLTLAKERFSHVIAIAGNHEFYGGDLVYKDPIRDFYDKFGIAFLDCETWTLDGVTFYGGTMWTRVPPQAKASVQLGLNDYRRINYYGNPLVTEHTEAEYAFFQLNRPKKVDVVISHHAPHFNSVHARYHGDILNHAFYTNTDMSGVKHWIHGHMHHSVRYRVEDTAVYANPRGYRGENKEFSWEASFEV